MSEDSSWLKTEEAKKEASWEIMKFILKQNDIDLNLSSCGCCYGTSVKFSYKGKPIVKGYTTEFKTNYVKTKNRIS